MEFADPPRAFAPVLALLVVLALLALAAALVFGSVPVDAGEMLQALWDRLCGRAPTGLVGTLLELRLPRALGGLAVGGLLALSGALLQALLRNALADPYVLGVSGGASCGALAAIALGLGAASIAVAAAGGAFAALAALFALAHRALFARESGTDGGHDSTILLTGVMIASLSAAAVSLALALAPDGKLRSMVFWLLGDLSGTLAPRLALGAGAVWLAALAVALRDARALNLLLGGDLLAYTQGVATVRVRRRLLVLTALASGTAVAVAGAVGFVGFVAPHLARRWLGSDQRRVLPAASLLGAILVVAVDTAGRVVAAPLQLPVGALTALVGVPVFLWQLQRP